MIAFHLFLLYKSLFFLSLPFIYCPEKDADYYLLPLTRTRVHRHCFYYIKSSFPIGGHFMYRPTLGQQLLQLCSSTDLIALWLLWPRSVFFQRVDHTSTCNEQKPLVSNLQVVVLLYMYMLIAWFLPLEKLLFLKKIYQMNCSQSFCTILFTG